MHRVVECSGRAVVAILAALVGVTLLVSPLAAQIDVSRYMAPEELKRGMKGFGRTVLAGTKIETFDFEVISIMRNAWYAKQDVILVRCSGLNLEHSGIVAGMSGSPCYIRDAAGRERMIGAVAFGWSFNKDPICGLQPITQMLPIPQLRDPQKRPTTSTAPASETADHQTRSHEGGQGVSLGEVIAHAWGEPIDPRSRFSVFNEDLPPNRPPDGHPSMPSDQLCPIETPVMVSGVSARNLGRLSERFNRLGLTLVASGSPSVADQAAGDKVVLEPGSVLCVPLLSGDMTMEALGTCTEVVGDKVLGFGHSLFGKGFVELPLATGMVHTVIPSVLRSNKLGATLQTVGTLWGDDASGIFGIRGRTPTLAPLDVLVHDVWGDGAYHYQLAQDRMVTSLLLSAAVGESIFAHNSLPDEHVVRYNIEVEFENIGTFQTSNFTSQVGTYGVEGDLLLPVLAMTNTPFGNVRIARAKVDVTITAGAKQARIERVQLPRTVYKPGETVTAQVRWFHYRHQPTYSDAAYELKLPADLRDGEYELTVGSAGSHLGALRKEKPHLWRVENLSEALATLNLMGSFSEDRLYMRLTLPQGGVAIGRVEMPELPSFRQKIVADAKRGDVERYSEAMLVQYETGFTVVGSQSFKIRVQRKDDY